MINSFIIIIRTIRVFSIHKTYTNRSNLNTTRSPRFCRWMRALADVSLWKSSRHRLRPWKWKQPVIPVAALAAGSTGSRRRRRCSLCVHLPRGKGGWPRPWCAWFSRARSFTTSRENGRSVPRPTTTDACTRLLNYPSCSPSRFSSLLLRIFPLAFPCLSSSLRVARLIFFSG